MVYLLLKEKIKDSFFNPSINGIFVSIWFPEHSSSCNPLINGIYLSNEQILTKVFVVWWPILQLWNVCK